MKELPPPYRASDDALARAVAEYREATDRPDPRREAAAFARLRARPRPRRARLYGLATASVCGALALWVWRAGDRHLDARAPLPPSPEAAAALPVRPPLPEPSAHADQTFAAHGSVVLSLGPSPVALPRGRSRLRGEAEVTLSAEAHATARRDATAAHIHITRGAIALAVEPHRSGRSLSVRAGGYEFAVLGTVFEVSHTSDRRVRLSVREGRVAVLRRGRLLAVITAGGLWQSPPSPGVGTAVNRGDPAAARRPAAPPMDSDASLAVAAPDRPPALRPSVVPALAPLPTPAVTTHATAATAVVSAPDADACAGLAGQGRIAEAVRCAEALGQGQGTAAEIGLYQLATLRRDRLGDPAGALAALRAHQRRFPSGVLRLEVALSVVELLPRLGQHQAALDESARLLAGPLEPGRRAELRLLRGNVWREVYGDCARGAGEYAEAGVDRGRIGDEASFLHAACLETLGRFDEARAAYGRYLRRPEPARAREAQGRLDRLAALCKGARC
jgi:hypothetical protein